MKRSIYVVDDQEKLLEMTVMVLRCLGLDWEITGFSDPVTALEAVKQRPPDAVLTDQMMPVMEGSKLLEQVRAISPATIRLIMSGYVALDKLTLITSAHQYIAKPFDAGKLRDLIQRSFSARDRITGEGLQTVVTSIRNIPSLRQAHHSLLAELRNPESAGVRVAELIAKDPGLSVKVLQLANSGLFGQARLVSDLVDAVNCLGFEMITAVVLSQSMFRHYETIKHKEIDVPKVWAHSWEAASQAQRLCRDKCLPLKTAEEAFLAGLLHEVGRFVLYDNFPEQFKAAHEIACENKITLAAALRETIRATPAQMSTYVLELWGLPGSVINSISLLDNPAKDPASGFSMTGALYIAEHLASVSHPADDFAPEPWNTEYLQSIGCAEEAVEWEQAQVEAAACANQ